MPGADAAFGTYASRYDEHFTNTAVGRRLRNRVWRYVARRVSPQEFPRVLEINCGTGEDATWLTQKGFSVTATDVSAEMISETKKKAAARSITFNTVQAGFDELEQQFETGSFDLIFSNFGGLNCVDAEAVKRFSATAHRLLRPGGRLIVVVMSRDCPWERRYFLRKGKRDEVLRRLKKDGVPVQIDGKDFFTWYYDTKEFSALLGDGFSLQRKRPVGWLLPPSYLNPFFERQRFVLGFLDAMERLCGGSLFADQGDHFLADYIKQ